LKRNISDFALSHDWFIVQLIFSKKHSIVQLLLLNVRILVSLFACFFFFSASSNAQNFAIAEDSLAKLALLTTRDSVETTRKATLPIFEKYLLETLQQPNSFHYSFEKIEAISIQTPSDSSFRIFTWMYALDNQYHFGGIVQLNDKKNTLFPLTHNRASIENPEFDVLTPKNWFGGVYYNLVEYKAKKGKNYLLFGYDAFSLHNRVKFVEVLSFDSKGEPRFGAPVFYYENASEPRSRYIMEYSVEAKTRLNYDDKLKLIVFDHLIPTSSNYVEGETAMVTDGSYDGFELQKGVWKFKKMLFTQTQDEAPRPMPILDSRDKGVFGAEGGKLKKRKN
jgi:hypothetical protein